MPSQNRVGCDDRHDLRQHPTAQPFAKRGQPSPVIIRQPQTLMAQLGLQDAVLFAQVQDDLVLFVLEQPRKDATKSCTGITVRSLYANCWARFSERSQVLHPLVRDWCHRQGEWLQISGDSQSSSVQRFKTDVTNQTRPRKSHSLTTKNKTLAGSR
jgi:hypothetical protein